MKLHPDDTDEDYALFGKIVLLWGHVEARLITAIFLLIYEPNELPNKGIPQSFDRRIALALKGYATLSRYAAVKDEATEIIKTLLPLHKQRTVFVHGFYNGKAIPRRYVFGLVKWGKSHMGTLETHTYAREELESFILDLGEAAERMDTILLKTRLTPP